MSKIINLAFVVVSLESGGTENYLLRFLKYLLKEEPNLNITIICKGGKTGSLLKDFEELGVKIKVFKLGYLNLKNIKLFKLKLSHDYEVVCDLTGNFAGITMGLAKLNKIPKRIAFYRASSNHFKPSTFNLIYNKLMNKMVLNYSTSILSNSTSAFDFFYGTIFRKDKRFKVIKNGVNAEVFSKQLDKIELRNKYNLPQDALLIGHVGRLNAAKNFETIFKVVQNLKKESINGKKIYFVFCGRETDSESFKTELKNHEIEESCFCLGQQSKVHEVLQCYDLFYFPSITEGQPNALIESLISGLPFIASNIEAIKECLPEKAYDYLVDPLDVITSTNKILETFKNPNPLILKDWAIKEYEAEKRFKEFKDILLK
jgi:glycosyltransferase involved in cell wall biosynthesis